MKTIKDIIYLTVGQSGVQSMRKSYSGCKKGEIVVKLNVEVEANAFTLQGQGYSVSKNED